VVVFVVMFQINEGFEADLPHNQILAAQIHWANRPVSIISDLFHIQLCTVVMCSNKGCGYNSLRFDDMSPELSLHIIRSDYCTLKVRFHY